jgi:hypothetical protein
MRISAAGYHSVTVSMIPYRVQTEQNPERSFPEKEKKHTGIYLFVFS